MSTLVFSDGDDGAAIVEANPTNPLHQRPASSGEPQPFTNADFARVVAYMTARSAKWAGDSLMLPEWWAEPVNRNGLHRFIADMRGTLEYLERVGPKDEVP